MHICICITVMTQNYSSIQLIIVTALMSLPSRHDDALTRSSTPKTQSNIHINIKLKTKSFVFNSAKY